MNNIPRSEYPRPQFVRDEWLCLNGEWQFEIDCGNSGFERGLLQRELSGRIVVPFCPESELSGVHHVDFMNAVWYRRRIEIPQTWSGRRVLLHFQACDYDTTVWADGVEIGRHRGGFTPFSFDLGPVAAPGDTLTLVVRARDNNVDMQPRGKQAQLYANHGCMYRRTTGIWQTVWLEPIPDCALQRPRLTPDLANGRIHLEQPISKSCRGLRLRAMLKSDGREICSAECRADFDLSPRLVLQIPEDARRPWSPGNPHLYDLEIELLDESGKIVDKASSYAGLRSVSIDGKSVRINGQTVFQRLVLDQGYYPDGILTAPSDEALLRDIELSLAAGFNGARLHQKVFEERFLYHADRKGYLVWGEFPDWGANDHGPVQDHQRQTVSYVTEWLEVLERDYAHPCIIGWCPLNETWQEISGCITNLDAAMRAMFLATKAMDASRPVLDSSGYSHRVPESDVSDCHDYEQNPVKLKENQSGLANGNPYHNNCKWDIPYRGQPFFVSEFGGIWWNPDARPGDDSWGYGDRPKTMDEFYARFEGLCAVLLDNPYMFGYCYTQLTDVYQEQNGIYKFERSEKFDLERIRRAQQRPAAIEQLDVVHMSGRLN